MEEFVNFYKEFNKDFEVIIKKDKIYMRFQIDGMFQPNIILKSYNEYTLWYYYKIIILIIDVTAKINKLLKDLDI